MTQDKLDKPLSFLGFIATWVFATLLLIVVSGFETGIALRYYERDGVGLLTGLTTALVLLLIAVTWCCYSGAKGFKPYVASFECAIVLLGSIVILVSLVASTRTLLLDNVSERTASFNINRDRSAESLDKYLETYCGMPQVAKSRCLVAEEIRPIFYGVSNLQPSEFMNRLGKIGVSSGQTFLTNDSRVARTFQELNATVAKGTNDTQEGHLHSILMSMSIMKQLAKNIVRDEAYVKSLPSDIKLSPVMYIMCLLVVVNSSILKLGILIAKNYA